MKDITKNLELLITYKEFVKSNKEKAERGCQPTPKDYIELCKVTEDVINFAIEYERWVIAGCT